MQSLSRPCIHYALIQSERPAVRFAINYIYPYASDSFQASDGRAHVSALAVETPIRSWFTAVLIGFSKIQAVDERVDIVLATRE